MCLPFLIPGSRLSIYIGSAATDLAVVKDRIAREGVELMPKDAAPEVPQIPRSQSSEATEPPAKKRKLSSWLKEAKGTGTSSPLTADQKVQKEIEDYLLAPALDSESNPLGWWKIHAGDFPIMAKVAQKYLCICASSSASERVFSTSGQIVSKRRSALKPDKVNMLVFLARNLS